MKTHVEIDGKKYRVQFNLYVFAEFRKEQGITTDEMWKRIEAGDEILTAELFWKGIEAGATLDREPLDISFKEFAYQLTPEILLSFFEAFNNQTETDLPENPTPPGQSSQ